MSNDNKKLQQWLDEWLTWDHIRDSYVDNVDEAVELAKDLQSMENALWFRGQAGLWPLVTSIARTGEHGHENAMAALEIFRAWAQMTPGLCLMGEDDLLAIAQHHGVPTPFIDFTSSPEIAAFFATHSEKLRTDDECCIICLNKEKFSAYFEIHNEYHPEEPGPEILQFNVPNLWRLEAQEGGFLYLPFFGAEKIYRPDRIVFPYRKPFDGINVSEVYPERKSHLENLLDGFFLNERTLASSMKLRKSKDSINFTTAECALEPFLPESLDVPKLMNGYWAPENIDAAWVVGIPEHWRQVSQSPSVEIIITERLDLAHFVRAFEDHILTSDDNEHVPRKFLVNWSLVDEDGEHLERAESASDALNRLWDGIRSLPYTDMELAKAMGMCLTFALHWNSDTNERRDLKSISSFIDDPMRIEVADGRGAFCRAYVSRTSLRNAVRKDIEEIVIGDRKESILGSMESLIRVCTSPFLLYEFEALRQVFVESILATQCVVGANKAPIYSPVLCKTLGLP